ncbi:MAG: hypothetical protein R3B54_02705 [Bdellovibrionota bacterium]
MEAIRTQSLTAALLLLLLSQPARLFAASGTWPKASEGIPKTWSPGFWVTKYAVFGRKGNVRFVWSEKDQNVYCASDTPLTAWVTHRLSPQETLSEKAAETAGSDAERLP